LLPFPCITQPLHKHVFAASISRTKAEARHAHGQDESMFQGQEAFGGVALQRQVQKKKLKNTAPFWGEEIAPHVA
jgi:hypothetical protein